MKRTCLLIATLAAVAAFPANAQDLNGEQILRRVDKDHRSNDERGVVEMILESKDGKKQRRSMEMLFKQAAGDDDMNLLRFLDPPNIRGTSLLTVEATGREDDQWIYLPALKKSKKIASSKRTNRFAATDFTYEDLRTEDFANNTYAKLPDTTVEFDGKPTPCFVVEARPKEGSSSGYSKRVIYVEKARFLTLKAEFFDPKDRHQKTLVNRGFEQVSGVWRSRQSMMSDHLRETKTVWRFSERKINPGLSDTMFTVRSLERGI